MHAMCNIINWGSGGGGDVQDKVSLYSIGTRSVDQAGLKLRDLPVSASQMLGLKACTTTA